MWVDNVPLIFFVASNWFFKMIFFIKMFCLKWDWTKNLIFMRFYVHCFVIATYGSFNDFIMIVWFDTNILSWFLAKMRKRSYVESNEAFHKVCNIEWVNAKLTLSWKAYVNELSNVEIELKNSC